MRKTYNFSAVDNYVEQLSSREAEETATITARNFRIKARIKSCYACARLYKWI